MGEQLERDPKTKNLPHWVPVIFANGVDDDTPGMIACFANEPVQYEDKIYQPYEEMEICDVDILMTRGLRIVTPSGAYSFPPSDGDFVTVTRPANSRRVLMNHCHFHFQNMRSGWS